MIAKDSLNMSKQNCQNNSGYMNCAIYARVSTDNQAEVEFNSCQAQEGEITQRKERFTGAAWRDRENRRRVARTGEGVRIYL